MYVLRKTGPHDNDDFSVNFGKATVVSKTPILSYREHLTQVYHVNVELLLILHN